MYKDMHTGELVSKKRRPPPKLHDMLPTDKVELKFKKNEDWDSGEELTVKSISDRSPNVVQIKNEEGESTFVSSIDLNLVEEQAYRPGKSKEQRSSKYLLWP